MPVQPFNMMSLFPTLLQLAEQRRREEEEAPDRLLNRKMKEAQLAAIPEELAYKKWLQEAEQRKIDQESRARAGKERAGTSVGLLMGQGPSTEASAIADIASEDVSAGTGMAKFLMEQPTRDIGVEKSRAEVDKIRQELSQLHDVKLETDEEGNRWYTGYDPRIQQGVRLPWKGDLGLGASPEKLPPGTQEDIYYSNLLMKMKNGTATPVERARFEMYTAGKQHAFGRSGVLTSTAADQSSTQSLVEVPPNLKEWGIGGGPRTLASSFRARPTFAPGYERKLQDEIDVTDNTMAMIPEIKRTFDPKFLQYGGKAEGFIRSEAEKFMGAGANDFVARQQAFHTAMSSFFDALRLAVTGQAMAEAEAKRMAENYASGKMSESQFTASMNQLKKRLEQSRKHRVEKLNRQDPFYFEYGEGMEMGKDIEFGGNRPNLNSEDAKKQLKALGF